jgi:hypothetical protein
MRYCRGGITVAGGDLVWRIIKEMGGDITCTHGLRSTARNDDDWTYRLYDDASWWVCERPSMTIGPLSMAAVSRRARDYEEAKRWAEQDWAELQRLEAWIGYMMNNPPASS